MSRRALIGMTGRLVGDHVSSRPPRLSHITWRICVADQLSGHNCLGLPDTLPGIL